MNRPQFDELFQTATGNSPYGYQCRLACGNDAHHDKPETLVAGCECRSRLINVPTGLGKTAAVGLALESRSADADIPGVEPAMQDFHFNAAKIKKQKG